MVFLEGDNLFLMSCGQNKEKYWDELQFLSVDFLDVAVSVSVFVGFVCVCVCVFEFVCLCVVNISGRAREWWKDADERE